MKEKTYIIKFEYFNGNIWVNESILIRTRDIIKEWVTINKKYTYDLILKDVKKL